MRRVVVTGLGILSPLGNTPDAFVAAVRAKETGISRIEEFVRAKGLRCHVGGRAREFDPMRIPRPTRRSMGRMAVMAALAGEEAARHAGLSAEDLSSGEIGVSVGSTTGSPAEMEDFFRYLFEHGRDGVRSTVFLKCMGHTCAANLALHLGITGRVIAPASACASGSQGIGLGFESIRSGAASVMLCGGADELHSTVAGTFDIVNGASIRFNDRPEATPRPFDADRDGLVASEGAAILVLEDLDRARKRGARICGEVLAFATNAAGSHMANPRIEEIEGCMRAALAGAGVASSDIDYVNAHATATVAGDAAEAEAVRRVFGGDVRVSSLKGHMGHAMGASGAIESVLCLRAMTDGFVPPTRNLDRVAEDCKGIRHVTETESFGPRLVLKNSFAFGGVNTSLVFGPPPR